MNYNFHSGILLGDVHSKDILIIVVRDLWNFRKSQEWFSEFQWNEDRTQKRKTNRSTDKKEFQQDEHEASEFHIIGWECYKRNNAALFLECKYAWNPSPIIQSFSKD